MNNFNQSESSAAVYLLEREGRQNDLREEAASKNLKSTWMKGNGLSRHKNPG